MPMLVRSYKSLLAGLLSSLVLAATGTTQAMAQTSDMREMEDAVAHAYAQGTAGPATIALRDVATLNLPKGYVFVPAAATHRLMHGMGNASGTNALGVIIPGANYGGWFIELSVAETGRIDGAALAKLDAEEIRGTIAAAARRGNASRMELGSSPIDAGAFLEPPKYDATKQSFTTAIRIFESGPSTGSEDSVNVDTSIFGRTHTLEVSLVDGLSDYAKHRAAFDAVVAAVSFTPGHRAQDFVAGRDAVAVRAAELVFGGRNAAELAVEAAEQAAETKRLAALPPKRTYETELKLGFFGLLGLVALVLARMGLRTPSGSAARAEPTAPQQRREGGIDRLQRKV